ncbi:MAG: hypothetical protein IKV16_04850 [Clostridia bacterium]|nr:hypothetical protein [Clostridia bacterium]
MEKELLQYNFSDNGVWSWMVLFAVLLGSLLIGNVLKKAIPPLKASLVPTSVLGGIILLIIEAIFKAISGQVMFDTALFGGQGTKSLEIITYHALGLGFVASALKTTGGRISKKRSGEIFDTGVTTVSTYLLQGILGLIITISAAAVIVGFFPASGLLLPFGFGQGSGQALNYGNIYEQLGFDGGRSFGLTIAALGFISASVGGVIHLNLMKRCGKLKKSTRKDGSLHTDEIESYNEIPMQESVDKMTIQLALIAVSYLIAYFIMAVIAKLLPGMSSLIFGFNFLIGVLSATLVKLILNLLRKKGLMRRKHTNNFLLTRVSNFFFDLMIVSGVAAIRLDILENYWGIMIILGVVGAIATYVYTRFVAKRFFHDYYEEQFLATYGMLTGTASTGIILLREVDPDFKTPASDNLVYQNFPAIVFGLPLMFLANYAPKNPVVCLIILAAFFAVMNVILFRRSIFSFFRKKHKEESIDSHEEK